MSKASELKEENKFLVSIWYLLRALHALFIYYYSHSGEVIIIPILHMTSSNLLKSFRQ